MAYFILYVIEHQMQLGHPWLVFGLLKCCPVFLPVKDKDTSLKVEKKSAYMFVLSLSLPLSLFLFLSVLQQTNESQSVLVF